MCCFTPLYLLSAHLVTDSRKGLCLLQRSPGPQLDSCLIPVTYASFLNEVCIIIVLGNILQINLGTSAT